MAKILIVDDDVDALKLVGLMLERQGYQIIAANNGMQALEKATTQAPDLIILDVMMPDLDGYQVARRLRQHPATQNVPILMFTAKSSVADKIAGFQAGVNEYLTKPIHPAELIARVQVTLQHKAAPAPPPPRGQLIAFLPCKGGVGNSTLALNVAIMLAQQAKDKKVLLIELTRSGGTLGMQLNLTVPGSLQALIKGGAALAQENFSSQIVTHSSGLHLLLNTSRHTEQEEVPENVARTVLDYALADYDWVLVDLSPTLHKTNQEVLRRAHRILLSIESSKLGMGLARTLLDEMYGANININKTGVVLINRVPSAATMTRSVVEEKLGRTFITTIPPVPDLAFQSLEAAVPLILLQPGVLLARQLQIVVDTILGRESQN